MFNLIQTISVIVLLYTISSINLINCVEIDFSSKFDSIDKPISSSIKPSDSVQSSNSLDSIHNKFNSKKNQIDLDYNQDLITRFEHPNSLNKNNLNNLKNNLNSNLNNNLNTDSNIDLLSNQLKLESNDQQRLSNRQAQSNKANRRMTRILFLVGSKQATPNQQDQSIKKPNELDDYLTEPSNPVLFKRTNFEDQDYYDSILSRHNRFNQYNNQIDNEINEDSFVNPYSRVLFNNQMDYNRMSNEVFPSDDDQSDHKGHRIKKALSLFAHWRNPETSFLREGDSSTLGNSFSAFGKMMPRAHLAPNRRPYGAPLRWG